ncbi:MAG: DUF86 domain-containing protein [Planctomycetaceae bacterium]
MLDETYLLDMFNAAFKAMNFVAGLDFDKFKASELHQSAVVKQLEVIGEAANRVSESFKSNHPEILWRQIIGMRHRLIHDYTRIDVSTVWETVQTDLSELIDQLKPLIPEEDET